MQSNGWLRSPNSDRALLMLLLLESLPTVIGTAAVAPALLFLWLVIATDERPGPPTRVWSVLTDFRAYAPWNPFITAIDGKPQPGAQLRVTIAPPGRRPMTFRAS